MKTYHFNINFKLNIKIFRASQVALVVKRHKRNVRRRKRNGFNLWVRKIPWRRAQQPTPVYLPEDPKDRGAWWATVHKVAEPDPTEAT